MNLVFSISNLNLTSKCLNEIKSKCIPQITYSEPILMNNNCYNCGEIKIYENNKLSF